MTCAKSSGLESLGLDCLSQGRFVRAGEVDCLQKPGPWRLLSTQPTALHCCLFCTENQGEPWTWSLGGLRPRKSWLQSCGMRKVSQMMWYLKGPTGREGGHRDAFKDAGCLVRMSNGEQGGVCLRGEAWYKHRSHVKELILGFKELCRAMGRVYVCVCVYMCSRVCVLTFC